MAHQDVQIEPDRDTVASIRERLVSRAFACSLRQQASQQGGEHRRGGLIGKIACFSGPAQRRAHRDGDPKEDSDSLLVLTHDSVEVLNLIHTMAPLHLLIRLNGQIWDGTCLLQVYTAPEEGPVPTEGPLNDGQPQLLQAPSAVDGSYSYSYVISLSQAWLPPRNQTSLLSAWPHQRMTGPHVVGAGAAGGAAGDRRERVLPPQQRERCRAHRLQRAGQLHLRF